MHVCCRLLGAIVVLFDRFKSEGMVFLPFLGFRTKAQKGLRIDWIGFIVSFLLLLMRITHRKQKVSLIPLSVETGLSAA